MIKSWFRLLNWPKVTVAVIAITKLRSILNNKVLINFGINKRNLGYIAADL